MAQNICLLGHELPEMIRSENMLMLGHTPSPLPLFPSSLYSGAHTHTHTHTHFKHSIFQRRLNVKKGNMSHFLSKTETTTSPIKDEYQTLMPNNKWYRTILQGNSKILELIEASLKIAC